jgi:putative PIN family toxin of toxin-antitoxin system
MKKGNSPRVVLDTNIIISGIIIPQSIPGKIFEVWQKDDFILLVSQGILQEINQVLLRDHISKNYHLSLEKIEGLIKSLKSAAELLIPIKKEELKIHCRDAKDDLILALAIGGNADYLVTGDKDLLVLKKEKGIGKLKIVSAKEFLACL